MAPLSATIWRDFQTDGMPASGAHKPIKAEIREWGTWLENLTGSGLVYATKAELDADLAHAANTAAWVVADPTEANNGIYQKIGASGSGSWLWIAPLPEGDEGSPGPIGPQGPIGPAGAEGREGADNLAQRYRAGDAYFLHTTALTGGDPHSLAYLLPSQTTGDDDGQVARVTGNATIASRTMFALEPARTYQARFVVRRRVNTPDPANDSVTLAIAWYDQNKIRLPGASGQVVVQNITNLTTASGRFQLIKTVSRLAGSVDFVAPATARYGRPYVETFGTSHQTDVEILDLVDTSDLIAWAPDVAVFDARVTALEAVNSGERLDILEAEVNTPSILRFQTRGSAIAATIPATPDEIEVINYAAAGDFGGARYKRAASEPTHAGKFQSADGAWWELAELQVTLEMFGGKADGVLTGTVLTGTDNIPAINQAMEYVAANVSSVYRASAGIVLGYGQYAFYSTIKLKHNVKIAGLSGAGQGNASVGAHLLFPENVIGFKAFSAVTIDANTGLAAGTDAAGAELVNLRLDSAGGTDRTRHAISMQARLVCHGLRLLNFPGNGYNITSNPADGGGNVNNWEIYGGRVSGCQNGIFTQGGDSNAGVAHHVDCSSNRQAGILDRSFLGNTYIGCHENSDGTLALVSDGTNRYRANPTVALLDNPAPLRTTVPGTNPAIWALVGAGAVSATYPLWVSGNEYVVGGQKISTNANARTSFVGGYSEPGFPASFILTPATIIGGTNSAGIHASSTGSWFNDGGWTGLKGVSSTSFTARASGSEFSGFVIHNEASLSAIRKTRFSTYLSFKADGVTNRPSGGLYGFASGALLTDNGGVGLEYYDATGDAWAIAVSFNGKTLVGAPGADNVWSFGSFALRWLKGWFGNISLFPAASVTPANNGEVTFQLTNNTTLAFRVKGLDGVVRTASVTLA